MEKIVITILIIGQALHHGFKNASGANPAKVSFCLYEDHRVGGGVFGENGLRPDNDPLHR